MWRDKEQGSRRKREKERGETYTETMLASADQAIADELTTLMKRLLLVLLEQAASTRLPGCICVFAKISG